MNYMAYDRETREKAVKIAREIGSREAAKAMSPGPTESAIRAWMRKEDLYGDVMFPADVYERRRKSKKAKQLTPPLVSVFYGKQVSLKKASSVEIEITGDTIKFKMSRQHPLARRIHDFLFAYEEDEIKQEEHHA